ncbi:MAG: hypothetical protein K1X53_05525 [Candidatus Sumerlaeaceae bacterium]|nr:hypothetical protein [Candidatus Sumerlaeaceae bacterium]
MIHRIRVTLVLVACLLVLIPSISHPNASTAEYDSSVAGQLVPKTDTTLEVVEEYLDIRFERLPWDLSLLANRVGWSINAPVRVYCTASYRIRNPSKRSVSPLLVFPIMFGGSEGHLKWVRSSYMHWFLNKSLPLPIRRGVRFNVDCGGTTVPSNYVSFESLFGKHRQKWIKSIRDVVFAGPNPERLEQERKIASNRLDAPKRATDYHNLEIQDFHGVRVKWSDGQLDDSYNISRDDETTRKLTAFAGMASWHWDQIVDWDLDFLAFCGRVLNPGKQDDIQEMLDRWGVEQSYILPDSGERFSTIPTFGFGALDYNYSRMRMRIDFMEFKPELKSESETTLTVRFSHLLDNDLGQPTTTSKAAPTLRNNTNQFQYILKTAKNWKSFGPIHLAVRVPKGVKRASSIEMKQIGTDGDWDVLKTTLDGKTIDRNLLIGLEMPYGTPESNKDVK